MDVKMRLGYKNMHTTYSSSPRLQSCMWAPVFLSWGQRGGRQKNTGWGQKTRAGVSLSEVTPNTPVRPTQNIRFMNTFPISSFHHKIANRI